MVFRSLLHAARNKMLGSDSETYAYVFWPKCCWVLKYRNQPLNHRVKVLNSRSEVLPGFNSILTKNKNKKKIK